MKFTDNTPIFLQIALHVEQMIERGEWVEGERVPSTRELAVSLSVNPATVMRAYDHLTSLGVIEQQRGLGYFVCTGSCQKIVSLRRSEFFEHTMPEFFAAMTRLGVTFEQVRASYESRNIKNTPNPAI